MNQFPFPIPFMQSCSQNNIEQQLASIEAELKKINAKLDKMDNSNFNSNPNPKSNSNIYIQKDDNLYML